MGIMNRLRILEAQAGDVETYFGTRYFVDAKVGSDSNSGRSPTAPFLTMAKAFTVIKSGDQIVCRGKIREQIETPAGVFDVQVVGGANRPRHADDHSEGGTLTRGSSSATWTTPSSPTAATPLVKVRQQGWRFHGILFDGPSDAACIQIFRDAGAGDAEDDGSHCWISMCKFVAGQNHIEFNGGLSQCLIEDCFFLGATADSIIETVGAGVGTNNYHEFYRNHWQNNVGGLDVALNQGTIAWNTFGKHTAGNGSSIDLQGGNDNMVYGNSLYGTYSIAGGYRAGTNDEWGGNFNSLAGGITASDPA